MHKLKLRMTPFFFIGPAVFLLIVFSIIPIFISLGLGFTDMDLLGLADWSKVQFVGLDHFESIFKDDVFIKSIGNTFFYVLIGVPIVIVLSLAIALLLNYGSNILFSGFRAVYYMPSITNIVAVAVIWSFLYNQEYGLFNYLISSLGFDKVPWLQDPLMAKFSLLLLAIWKNIGVDMIIFLAALQAIPKMYYEAAVIDGANRWQKLKYITLPSLSYAIFFVSVTKLIGWLQFFEEPFVMTGGGPLDGTVSMALFIYQEGFQESRFGYAGAASFILFIIIIFVTIVQFSFKKKEEM